MLSCCSTLCNTRIYVICVLMTLSLLRGRSRVRSTSQVQAIPERRVITRAMDLPPSYLKHLNQALMKLPQEKRQELFDTYERAQGILVSAIDSHVVALPLRMQPHFGEILDGRPGLLDLLNYWLRASGYELGHGYDVYLLKYYKDY